MRIFISHGTDKEKAHELAFLDALDTQLAAPPAAGPAHEVLLDRTRIGAGDDWQGLLHDAIAECQAAILLLTQRALDRPWVLKEATLLSYRKSRDPLFPFYCVLRPDVGMADVNARPAFAALGLDAIQAFPPAATAQDVADWVKSGLAQRVVPETTPLDELQAALETHLAHADGTDLEKLCEELLGEPVKWDAAPDRSRLRARTLARGIVRGRALRVSGLAGLIKALKKIGLLGDPRREVLKLAASMWIDADVSGRLGGLSAGATAGRADVPLAAALNSASIRYGARMVAWRALMPDTSEFIYWIEGGGADDWEDELVRRIRRAYRKGKEELIPSDEHVDKVLGKRRQPVVFVLPPPVPDDLLLQALRARYQRVTFIAHTGDVLPPMDTLPGGVVALAPGLDPDAETDALADYDAALEALV